MKQLENKVAIITGGSSGIGHAAARLFARHGARLVLVARRRTELDALVAQLADGGAQAVACVGDVGDAACAQGAVALALQRFGGLDIAFNNAGTLGPMGPTQEVALEDWRATVDTNLTSAFLCSQAAHIAMKRGGGGKIINIGSMMSIFGASFAPAYAASKGGIVQFTRSCAVAWAPDNVQCNVILPGWIDTELTQNARREVDGLHAKVLARTPAARWGTAEDFAGIAVFLGSAASDFVTGTAIPVDGGFSVQG